MSLDLYLHEMGECVWEGNITHNLGKMASEAGLYQILWRPGEDVQARDVFDKLIEGLAHMLRNKEALSQFDAANGWGTYENLLEFVFNFTKACGEYPDAVISASV